MNTTAKKTVAKITIKTAVTTFLNVEMIGKSNATETWYKKLLLSFAKKIGARRSVNSILETDLIDWRKNLESLKLAPATKHGHIRAVRKFCKFLFARNYLSADLSHVVKLPTLPKRARKGISEENAIAILNASKNNLRDYALILFLESTNARRGGIATLTIENLALNNPEPLCRRATVHEKGNRDRIVMMSRETLKALKEWLASREIDSPYVFTTASGKPLTPDGVSEILSRYKTHLKLQGRCSPHEWRHRWCRKRLQDKMPLPQVSQLAGHKSIVVTADFYGTFAQDELCAAFDEYYKPPE